MDDLVVDSHLHAIIVDDKDADTASAVVERFGQTVKETALVKDRKTLLDVASLGHGDNTAVLTDVENTVLLEDRTKHILDDDRWGRVGDEARLLMELLCEKVDTKVTVLASLGRGGNADDLARAALKDQEIANADVVAWDGDGVRGSHGAWWSGGYWGSDANSLNWNARRDGADWGRTWGGSSSGVLLLDNDFLLAVVVLGTSERVVVGVVVAMTVDGMGEVISYLVSSLRDTVAERVVMTVFVVISHITLVLLGGGRQWNE